MIIPLPFAIYHKNIGHSNRRTLYFLSLQRFFYFVFLPFQIILLLIQTIPLFAELLHTLQLRPHSLSAIRLCLFILPGQIADFIIVLFNLFRYTYPVNQVPTSISVSYNSVSVRIVAHSRTITFFSISVISIQSSLSYRLIQRHVSGVYLPFLPVPMPFVPLSTVSVPCLNDAPNAPNQTLFPAISLWCRSAP